MTWRELKKYIQSQEEYFLEQPVKIFDFNTGEEFLADVTELHCHDGWIPYISINAEVKDGKTQETGID